MMADLAALTPPLVMCVAFLVGVAMLLRHQLAPKRGPRRAESAQEAREVPEEPAPETTRGPADPAYPAKPDKPARAAMSRDGANDTSSAGDHGRRS
jgi:hypothetical protein